jgi:hypothetical protein
VEGQIKKRVREDLPEVVKQVESGEKLGEADREALLKMAGQAVQDETDQALFRLKGDMSWPKWQ